MSNAKPTRMTDREAIQTYILAGKSIFTLQSRVSGDRYTYKVSKPRGEDEETSMWFVEVLTGPDNTQDYTYLGLVIPLHYRRGLHVITTAKSRLTNDAPSVKAINWFVKQVTGKGAKLGQVDFWNAGRCSMCGRTLTSEYAKIGIGPKCITYL
jgi:hypothetical protein